jgi:hypothetical protein
MRNETASSLEIAGESFTGIKTRDSRRLPDQSEGGAMIEHALHYNDEFRMWCTSFASQEEQTVVNPALDGKKAPEETPGPSYP